MTIDEAIEILQFHTERCNTKKDLDLVAACKLGIEALNFRLRWEQQEGEDDFPRLPGETVE